MKTRSMLLALGSALLTLSALGSVRQTAPLEAAGSAGRETNVQRLADLDGKSTLRSPAVDGGDAVCEAPQVAATKIAPGDCGEYGCWTECHDTIECCNPSQPPSTCNPLCYRTVCSCICSM